MYCSNCGAKLEEEQNYCPICGKAINKQVVYSYTVDNNVSCNNELGIKGKINKKYVSLFGIIGCFILISIGLNLLYQKTRTITDAETLREKIVGTWELTEESKAIGKWSNYIKVNKLFFYTDGEWSVNKINDRISVVQEDGFGFNNNMYVIGDNSMVMYSPDWKYERRYEIEITNNVLKLEYPGDPPLYYNKIE